MINASPMKAPLRRMTGLTHKRPHKQALRMTAGTLGKALVSSPIKRRAIRIEAVGRLTQVFNPDVDRLAIADL